LAVIVVNPVAAIVVSPPAVPFAPTPLEFDVATPPPAPIVIVIAVAAII
jgi:hypothetical protein